MPNKPIIVIDPGHGGKEKVGGSSPNNAVGANGLLEKNLTLDMANRVAASLAAGADVFLTRAGDTNLGLSERAKFAREKGAQVFLSLHFNGFKDESVDGTEVWVAKNASQASRDLAKTLLSSVVNTVDLPNRGVREGELGVILPSLHAANTAACLLEVAFLSNPAQARRLAEDNYRQQLADAIAGGLRDQLRLGVAASQSFTGEYGRPFYDTGEHVLTGGDLYSGMLRVGKNPGVLFSYGQIIAMADLYASVNQMMEADVSELEKIKALIERNTKYYETNKKDEKLKVSPGHWEKVTNERFLKLAEDNYEHFSPDLLFKDAEFAKGASQHGNNKSEWERYHRMAIEEAQKMFLAPENQNRTPFLEYPLIINAFGDHFLTDAFAAGHLVNKEVFIKYFKFNFFDGEKLKPAGRTFFERVSKMAFKGNLAKRFKGLETASYPVCKWGWCLKWNPNIKDEPTFRKMLIQIAEQRPDAVANLCAKAFHDRLNEKGIEVFNDAGDKPWKLFGDEFLDTRNLSIIQKAVQQSIDNLNDRAILANNLNFGAFFSKVWKYVPQLPEASRKEVKRLAQEYTDPASASLAKKASEIIYEEVDSLIGRLIKEGKLKEA